MAGLSRHLRRALPGLCLGLALLALALAAQRGWVAWRDAAANRAMLAGTTSPGAPPRVVLAHAIVLEQRHDWDEALSAYAEAEALGDATVRHAVHVNLANLYLRRGIAAAREDGNAPRSLVLLQLAKSNYRRALRDDPDDWNARYNLELTTRLVPDFEQRDWRQTGNDTALEDPALRDKPAWTEMIGQPRGMP